MPSSAYRPLRLKRRRGCSRYSTGLGPVTGASGWCGGQLVHVERKLRLRRSWAIKLWLLFLRAAQVVSFKFMKAHVGRFQPTSVRWKPTGYSFIRKGESGDHVAMLSQDQGRRFAASLRVRPPGHSGVRGCVRESLALCRDLRFLMPFRRPVRALSSIRVHFMCLRSPSPQASWRSSSPTSCERTIHAATCCATYPRCAADGARSADFFLNCYMFLSAICSFVHRTSPKAAARVVRSSFTL